MSEGIPARQELDGWLLDLYACEQGVALWLLGQDGRRRRLVQDFPVTFYAAGPHPRLRELWRWLRACPEAPRLARERRGDLFQGEISVLAATLSRPADLPGLFRRVSQTFPELSYYDADVQLALRHAAAFGTFPLARCRVEVDGERVTGLQTLDQRWDIDSPPAPLRVLHLEPDCDPQHADPRGVVIAYERVRYVQPLEPARALLVNLRAVLERYDPDLLQTSWGDTWLLPTLLARSRELGLPLPLSRDTARGVSERKEHTYFSYGQIIYRGRQVHLHGRWHIDARNAMLWNDYGLEGALEMARVTAMPVQDAARMSPGTGISSMQFITALQTGVMVPWHKHQAERPKTALELVRADMGGMVYQPVPGLHADVAGIDFVSMYPGIMVRFNISPEVPRADGSADSLEPAHGEPGLVPQTLAPLLDKRLRLKAELGELHPYDPRRELFIARASAAKWLLVTCFGYLGYKNARFGRIEAHEAVTAYGREALLRAKEAAEQMGFEVLHLYVDGLWVRQEGHARPADFQPLLEEIAERTGLPIALDGVYRWVAFLSSRVDARVPVPNRYFGVFQDGSVKVRGVECRRRDTAPFIAETQKELLALLASAPDVGSLVEVLPQVQALLRRRVRQLKAGRVAPEQLLVSQRLSRELEAYRTPSPAARAARQLAGAGKVVKAGQRVRFVFMRGDPGVHAWDLPEQPDPRAIDVARYRTLLMRAAEAVLEPVRPDIGRRLRGIIDTNSLWGIIPSARPTSSTGRATDS